MIELRFRVIIFKQNHIAVKTSAVYSILLLLHMMISNKFSLHLIIFTFITLWNILETDCEDSHEAIISFDNHCCLLRKGHINTS